MLLRRFFHDAAAGVGEFRRLLAARAMTVWGGRWEERFGERTTMRERSPGGRTTYFAAHFDERVADLRHRRAGEHFDGFQVCGPGMIAFHAPYHAAHQLRPRSARSHAGRVESAAMTARGNRNGSGSGSGNSNGDFVLGVGFVIAALPPPRRTAAQGEACVARALQRIEGAAAGD